MRKLVVSIVLVLVVALVVGACATGPSGKEGPTVMPAPLPPGVLTQTVSSRDGAYKGGEGPAVDTGGQAVTGQSLTTDRMIIRTAAIDVVVDNVLGAVERIAQLAEQSGGYVVSSKTYGEGKKLTGTISIRVPADQFDATMRSLRAMAVKVLSQDESTRDVSEEYVDLQSRLRNLEATEQQLLRLMEKAATVEDALSVQRELAKVRGEVEQTKGRMQFLERSSETSLINVNLQGSGLDAEFAASATEVRTGEEVGFSDFTFGGEPPYSYEWSFGDGATSELKNPVHSYQKPGTYTVSLRVKDDKGLTDTETKKAFLTVTQAPGWGVGDVFGGAAKALVALARWLFTGLVWIVIFIPVWGLALGLAWWLKKRRKAA
ncbi:MAG: DUF4349 domain-containing protein [Chloroflexota bacterium]